MQNGSGGTAGELGSFGGADAPLFLSGVKRLYSLSIFTDGSNGAVARANWNRAGRYQEMNVRCAATDFKELPLAGSPVAVSDELTLDLVGTTSRAQAVVDGYSFLRTGYGKAAKNLVCKVTI